MNKVKLSQETLTAIKDAIAGAELRRKVVDAAQGAHRVQRYFYQTNEPDPLNRSLVIGVYRLNTQDRLEIRTTDVMTQREVEKVWEALEKELG